MTQKVWKWMSKLKDVKSKVTSQNKTKLKAADPTEQRFNNLKNKTISQTPAIHTLLPIADVFTTRF